MEIKEKVVKWLDYLNQNAIMATGIFWSFIFLVAFYSGLSLIIVSPLIFWGFVQYKVRSVKKNKQNKLKYIFENGGLSFVVAGLMFIVMTLFPKIFSEKGKLDGAIWTLVFFPPLAFIYWSINKGVRHKIGGVLRNFIWAVLAILLLGSSILSYGIFIESPKVIVKQVKIDVPDQDMDILEAKKIVLISDLHMGPIKDDKYLAKVVSKLNSIADETSDKTELVLLIPGDFVSGKVEQSELLHPLSDLSKKYSSFAVLGNHDFDLSRKNLRPDIYSYYKNQNKDDQEMLGTRVEEKLEEYGITVLRNDHVILSNQNKNQNTFEAKRNLVIIGIDDLWSEFVDIATGFAGVGEDDFTILLSHSPDAVLEIESNQDFYKRSDFVVSGHTHGGEIRLPFVRGGHGMPLFPLPIKISQKYDKGYFDYPGKTGKIPLYITSGVGQVGTPVRLFNEPEIIIFEFE